MNYLSEHRIVVPGYSFIQDDALKPMDIGSVLHYVNHHCSFIEAFDHILGRYAKQTREDRVLVACLIAWGPTWDWEEWANF